MVIYRYAYIPVVKGACPRNDAKVRSGNVVGHNSGPAGWLRVTADGSDPRTCSGSDWEAAPAELTRAELLREGASAETVRVAETLARTRAEYPTVDLGTDLRTPFTSPG